MDKQRLKFDNSKEKDDDSQNFQRPKKTDKALLTHFAEEDF